MMQNNTSILLVDDDADDRYMMHTSFHQVGWTDNLKLFENGMDLIKHLEQLPDTYAPSLIVLDKNMPVIDGIELLQYLRKNRQYNGVQVVVYSSLMTPELRRQLMSYGANGCYHKPKGITENIELARTFCNLVRSSGVALSASL